MILTPTLVSLISSKIPFTAAYYYNMSLHISIDCIFQTVYCSLCLSVSHSEALKFIDFAPKKIHLSTLSFLSYFVSFFILQTFLNNSPLILTLFFFSHKQCNRSSIGSNEYNQIRIIGEIIRVNIIFD